MKKTCLSPFTAVNVKHKSEPAATDTVYCDTPVIVEVSKCEQVFVVTKTLLTTVYDIEFDKQFVNSLEDNITQRGKMEKLKSDSVQSEINTRVKEILRDLLIDE